MTDTPGGWANRVVAFAAAGSLPAGPPPPREGPYGLGPLHLLRFSIESLMAIVGAWCWGTVLIEL